VRPNGDTLGKTEILADLRHHSMRFTSFEVNDTKLAVKSYMFRCESRAHFYARRSFLNSIVTVRGVWFELSNGRELFNN
jgi:hypothetical protein